MIHAAKNKAALHSKNSIADALFRLMQRKPFAKITVTEICEEAAVGRKTFYRNFDLREDVIDFRLDMLCEQYRQEMCGMDINALLYYHFTFVKNHADAFISLYQNGLRELSYQHFSVLLPQTMSIWSADPVEQAYHSAYIIAGIEAIQRVWVERGFSESTEDVIA